jgi:hypothetical protein
MTHHYELGFASGEHASFRDRRNNIVRVRPERISREYDRGWWDGYEPRSETWRLRPVDASKAWWVERETEREST